MRVLSVGSVPPEWGGQTRGGVAAVHQALIEELGNRSDPRFELLGILGLNRPPGAGGIAPASIRWFEPPVESRLQKDWYWSVLRDERPDAVLFSHVGHRWGLWHVRSPVPVPGIGVIHSWHQITFNEPDKAAKARANLEEILPDLAALIFPSEFTRREGNELGFRYDCPAHVVHNPIQPLFADRGGPTPETPVARKNDIIFVGSLLGRKRPEMVLRAAAEIGMGLTFLGSGDLEDSLRAEAAQLGISDSVRFLGDVSPQEVRRQLLSHAVLCVPSASESFGNVYLEALACGTPVVGFAPTLQEISATLGIDIGVGVSGSASQANVSEGIASVASQRWDRQLLADSTAAAMSATSVAMRYVDILERTIARRTED